MSDNTDYAYWLRDMADRETMPIRPCPKALRSAATHMEELEATIKRVVDTYYDNNEPCDDDVFDDLMIELSTEANRMSKWPTCKLCGSDLEDDDTCESVDCLKQRIEELEAENEKLKREVKAVNTNCDYWADKYNTSSTGAER